MTKTGVSASHTWGTSIQDHILRDLDEATLSLALAHRSPIKSIHETRTRVKRSRAGLLLLRGIHPKRHKREDQVLARAARSLGPIRDAQVTYLRHPREKLPPPYSPKVAAVVTGAVLTLSTSAARVSRWNAHEQAATAIYRELNSTYDSGRQHWRKASRSLNEDDLHRCRKSVKQLYYQMSILNNIGLLVEGHGELAGRLIVLDRLGELLGDHHDLTFVGGVDRAELEEIETDLTDLANSVFAMPLKKHKKWVRAHSA